MLGNSSIIGNLGVEKFASKIKLFAIVVVFFIVIVVNILFLYTYPINVGAMDNLNYLGMVYGRVSNLIHASGYPAFLILLQDLVGIHPVKFQYDLVWLHNIQILQVIFHLFLMMCCAILVAKIFGLMASALFLLTLGFNVLFMSGVGSFAPEWLLGDLLALVLLLALIAFRQANCVKKALLYGVSALIFSFAYLVKFNCLVIAPAVYVLIFLDNIRFRLKLTIGIAIGLIFWCVVLAYSSLFHYPTTKADRLTYDHAWVLIDALPTGYFDRPIAELGPASLRWKILSAVVPPDYSKAAAYCCENSGATESQRAPYRKLYNSLASKSVEELRELAKAHSLPPGFVSSISAIPLYWYVGLKETDDLGIEVFKESLRAMPLSYLEKIKSGVLYLREFNVHIVPFLGDTLELNFKNKEEAEESSSMIAYMPSSSKAPEHHLYWNPLQVVWGPGVIFFEKLDSLWRPNFFKDFFLIIVILGIAISWRSSQTRWANGALVLSIALFVSANCVLLGMRYKEVISIFPVMCILGASGATSVLSYLKAKLNVRW